LGERIKSIWQRYLNPCEHDKIENNFTDQIEVNEVSWMASFKFKFYHEKRKKALSKFMLNHDILACDKFYPSFAHTNRHVEIYENILKKYLKKG
jgi:hypothetical protein